MKRDQFLLFLCWMLFLTCMTVARTTDHTKAEEQAFTAGALYGQWATNKMVAKSMRQYMTAEAYDYLNGPLDADVKAEWGDYIQRHYMAKP